jgi:hypothetical protein
MMVVFEAVIKRARDKEKQCATGESLSNNT